MWSVRTADLRNIQYLFYTGRKFVMQKDQGSGGGDDKLYSNNS